MPSSEAAYARRHYGGSFSSATNSFPLHCLGCCLQPEQGSAGSGSGAVLPQAKKPCWNAVAR